MRNVIANHRKRRQLHERYYLAAMEELARRKDQGLEFQKSFDLIRKSASERWFLSYKELDITQAALRVIAESVATDNAARARRSKREQSLVNAIEEKVLGSEMRSRENGWSYVENLTKRLGKWPPRKK